jgi:UDP-2-acetamido-2,6-beta-L-arabino-hexul-4-ose reductase
MVLSKSPHKIGITGIRGLIGWHLRCHLSVRPDTQVLGADRETFADPARLKAFVADQDVILHLAGMNRGPDEEVARVNIELTRQLIEALEGARSKAHVIFMSSIQVERGTPYGKSKQECTRLLDAWAKRNGTVATSLVFPNVFGESGKPFYNSVVSTFCHQLAHGEEPKIIQDAKLELLHTSDVARIMAQAMEEKAPGEQRIHGPIHSVSEVLARLQFHAASYGKGIVPRFESVYDLQLFNTYRSHLFPQGYPVTPTQHTDPRGSLFEAVKSENGGQSFISSTHPGITRGNHYHFTKVERFCVIGGQARIRIRKLHDTHVHVFDVTGDNPQFIDMPTLHTHNITNTGKGELTTLFWSNAIFDPAHPDQHNEMVEVQE